MARMSAVERRVRAAFHAGAEIALAAGDPPLPGAVIADLLCRPVDRAEHPRAALRLRGATVTGPVDVTDAEIAVPVRFRECRFDAPVDLSGAQPADLRFSRCELHGLRARLVVVRGDVSLADSTVEGPLDLSDARIGGDLVLERARLRHPAGRALAAARLTVGGSLLGTGLHAAGELWLDGAQVGGNLVLDGAVLRNPSKRAVAGDRLVIGGNLRAGDGLDVHGELFLVHVQVGGQLWFVGATLAAPDGFALHLGSGKADSVWLCFAETPVGRVRLSGLRAETVFDDPAVWPARLDLVGCTYRLLIARSFEGRRPGPAAVVTVPVRRRLEWLRRSPDGYAPQPYEQLAEAYRRGGQDVEARRVLLEKQRRRRTGLHLPGRIGGYLLDGLVGYGYRTWQAGLWLLVFWALGAAAFTAWPPPPRNRAEAPEPSAALYALDLLLPIINLGHDTAWKPAGTAQYVAAALVVMGWVLTTAVVAGLSRIINR
ncbi:oxidoreductase [Actinoplanes sichuanensis]|uniref:Pentapeptide repeat-containing protein n=1 Tax=Actinoplanes sichuanensis TaxID=512349 RepID=A0ABW4AFW8_9ACTN|nr:pentapeptide repeat-containing protein [Actinoplanes sichuanensis]BEL02620.1 oxidoreductase [Actinoplanes sichuanensis]